MVCVIRTNFYLYKSLSTIGDISSLEYDNNNDNSNNNNEYAG